MRALFDLFLDICLFRKGPQDVPASTALLKICLLIYALSGFVVLLLSTSASVAILQVLLDLLLLIGLLHLALLLRRHPRRFEQTLIALAGVGTLAGLLALPLMFWIVQQGANGDIVLPSFLMLVLMCWSISIMAHILRHSLDIPIWAGGLCAVGYTFLSWTLTGWVG